MSGKTGAVAWTEGGDPSDRRPLVVTADAVHTLDPDRPAATVLVIADGRVMETGDGDLAARHAGARRLDLPGRTIVPGLIDAHGHLMGLGSKCEQVDLAGCASEDDMLHRVAGSLPGLGPGEWLLGRGWNHEHWPGRGLPTSEALSALVPDRPASLRRVDGHATLANAALVALSGITEATPDPSGGEIVRGADGRPTGVFVDAAAELLAKPPRATPAVLRRRALAAQSACLSVGLTCVHDAGVDLETLSVFEALMDEGSMTLRVNAMLAGDFGPGGAPEPWLARRLAEGPVDGARGGRLTVRAVKIYLDGALGSRGAALLEPYADRPGARGLLQVSRDELAARVRACRRSGFQAAVHAIGDLANRVVLDVFEEILGADATSDHRFRIEHAQVVAPADIPRFGRLGVVASMQPAHATSDAAMALERLGAERLRGAYAWRSLLASGARLALGSDFPVEGERPLHGLLAAATGLPVSFALPDERLTRVEALAGFTRDAAWAGFDDARLGCLSTGRCADFVVLPADPLTCDAATLAGMEVESTWLGGVPVYRRG